MSPSAEQKHSRIWASDIQPCRSEHGPPKARLDVFADFGHTLSKIGQLAEDRRLPRALGKHILTEAGRTGSSPNFNIGCCEAFPAFSICPNSAILQGC
jgi:hypothetical protein